MRVSKRSFIVIICSIVVTAGLMSRATALTGIIREPVVRPQLLTRCGTGPSSAAGWHDMFASLPRAMDGFLSTPLPIANRTAWVFGDTARLDTHDFIHNMLVVSCGSHLKQIGSAEAIPGKSDGSFYWGGPPVVDGSSLYVFAPHVRPSSDWPYFATIGTDVAKFDLPLSGADPVYKGTFATPSSDIAGKQYPVQWGAGVVSYGGYLYVYGTYQPTGAWGMSVRVARVPSGQLTTLSAWRYWNGSSWGTNADAAQNIIDAAVDGTDSAFSVHVLSGKVVITTKRSGAFSPDAGQFVSSNFTGPFTFTKLVDSPTTDQLHTYLAAAHPETGLRLMTINQQPQGRPWPDDTWAHPDDYRARWIEY